MEETGGRAQSKSMWTGEQESKWEWELRVKVEGWPTDRTLLPQCGWRKGRSEIVALDRTLQGRSPPHFRVQTPTNISVGTSRKPGTHLLAFNSSHKPQLQHTGRTYWLWISVTPELIVLALHSKENTGLVMPHYGLHLNVDKCLMRRGSVSKTGQAPQLVLLVQMPVLAWTYTNTPS